MSFRSLLDTLMPRRSSRRSRRGVASYLPSLLRHGIMQVSNVCRKIQ